MSPHPRRVLLVGSGSGLAPPVLRALLTSRHEVVALATPAPLPAPRGRVLLGADVVDESRAARVPVREVGRREDPRPLLDELRPDVVVVACFPWKLPAPWWTAPSLALNVHPSLLPRWRGPAPLFWQYHSGDGDTGVTVHHLSGALDEGPIAAQQAVPLDDDLDLVGAEARLGAAAGGLLVALLDEPEPGARPQPAHEASRQGWPVDFQLPAHLTARQAYRFVKLVGRTTPLAAPGLCVRDARGWSREPPPAGLSALRCRDGWLLLGPLDAHPAQGSSRTLPVV